MNFADYFTLTLLLLGALVSFLTLHAMATGFFIAKRTTRISTWLALAYCILRACSIGIQDLAVRKRADDIATNVMVIAILWVFLPVVISMLRNRMQGSSHAPVRTVTSLRRQ